MPIYIVGPKAPNAEEESRRLVKAQNPAQAIRHVAEATLSCEVATTEQAVELGAAGVKVESAASQ
mgnify:CR=1 FL=1